MKKLLFLAGSSTLLLITGMAWAETPMGSPTRAFTRVRQIPERGAVEEEVICDRTYEVSVTPPSGWRDEVITNELNVVFSPTEPGVSISVRMLSGGIASSLENIPQRRQRIIDGHPGATAFGELQCYAAGAEGKSIDLSYVLMGKFIRNSRVAIIPIAGGFLECELTAPADTFVQFTHQFGLVLNSLRLKRL